MNKSILLLLPIFIIGMGFAAYCGDGACNRGENSTNCGADCPAVCGDGYCGGSETWTTCQEDCNALCGNGATEGAEECDRGSGNSDTALDGCRTDCTLHRCGDGTMDTGEQCDEGRENSDHRPNWCKTTCVTSYCGDGIVDYEMGEECDLGQDNEGSGCNSCRLCYEPKDNLMLDGNSETLRLCPGGYEIEDSGTEGVVIFTGNDATLDCQGAELVGIYNGPDLQAGINGNIRQATQQSQQPKPGQVQAQKGDFLAGLFGAIANLFGAGPQASPEPEMEPQPNTPDLPEGAYMTLKSGTGIVVDGNNLLIVNCRASNFKTGIMVNGSANVLARNNFCGNRRDVDSTSLGNFGAGNSCGTAYNWNENGVSGCTMTCSGASNPNTAAATDCECPECVQDGNQECPAQGEANCTQAVCPECEVCQATECPACEQAECANGETTDLTVGATVPKVVEVYTPPKEDEPPAQTNPLTIAPAAAGTTGTNTSATTNTSIKTLNTTIVPLVTKTIIKR